MESLLVGKWDMELAHYCLGVYGGHIYDTYSAVERVAKGSMSAFAAAPIEAPMNIICCLEADNAASVSMRKDDVPKITNPRKLAGLKDTLRELAASGFVPLEMAYDDKARVLSKYNIAAVVDNDSFVFGLDDSRWDTTMFKYALVPSSQFMRMIIARDLDDSGDLKRTPLWRRKFPSCGVFFVDDHLLVLDLHVRRSSRVDGDLVRPGRGTSVSSSNIRRRSTRERNKNEVEEEEEPVTESEEGVNTMVRVAMKSRSGERVQRRINFS